MNHPLAVRLSEMLGSDAGIGYASIGGTGGLHPEELAAVAHAVPERQAEFAAGRRAARDALSAVGHKASAIPAAETRAPVWPEGIVGAITHDGGHALAAVLPVEGALGLGIDLTEAAPLPYETRLEILPHASEAGLTEIEARAGFSAKESLFKALFPVVGIHFDFSVASVAPSLMTGIVEIELMSALGPFEIGSCWTGQLHVEGSYLLTTVSVSVPCEVVPENRTVG